MTSPEGALTTDQVAERLAAHEFTEVPDLFGYVRIQHRLQEILGRRVDLVTVSGLKPRIRDRVLTEAHLPRRVGRRCARFTPGDSVSAFTSLPVAPEPLVGVDPVAVQDRTGQRDLSRQHHR